VSFALVDLSFALGLPVAYGILMAGCGPPSFQCFLRGGCAIAVCGDSWREFPHVMTFGALFGLLAAAVAAASTFAFPGPSPPRDPLIEALALSVGIAPIAILAGPPGLVFGLLAWPVIAAFLVAFSAPLLLRRPRPYR